MAKVALDKPASEFEIKDYRGQTVKLSDFRGQKQVLLVFNRGFA